MARGKTRWKPIILGFEGEEEEQLRALGSDRDGVPCCELWWCRHGAQRAWRKKCPMETVGCLLDGILAKKPCQQAKDVDLSPGKGLGAGNG